MTTTAAPSVKDQWTAYAQSLRLWVLQFVVWMAEWTGLRALRLHAQGELRYLRYEVRQILLARMAIEILAAPPKGRTRRAHVRERLIHYRTLKRSVLRGVKLRTFDEAKHVLEHLEAHVARCVANYRAGMKRRTAWSVGALADVSTIGDGSVAALDTS